MNSPSRPSRVRYSILGLLCTLAMITYLDRAMNGQAKKDIMESIGRPEADFFWVLTCFQVAYACFEIPTGWMGDTFGPRKTLLRIVLWWSLFVALTGCTGLALFGWSEVMIGFAGPAGHPVPVRGRRGRGVPEHRARRSTTGSRPHKRGFAQGSVWLAARLLGGFTPFIWILLTTILGLTWRQAIWLFAGVALAWCVVFYVWFRNRPDEHPAVNDAERELIEAGRAPQAGHAGVPWRAIFTSRNVWALCAMYMVTNFNWYFLMYNLPLMLKDRYKDWGTDDGGKLLLALLGGSPLLVGMAGCLIGGLLTDQYIRRTGDRKWGRRIFAMIGYGMAGLFYLAATAVTGPDSLWPFAICLMLVGFFNDFIMGPSWAAAQDIGRRYSAIVSGTMNMVGNLGATLGIQVTGRILRAYTTDGVIDTSGYVVLFMVYAAVYALGVGAWLLIDASKPILADDEAQVPHPAA